MHIHVYIIADELKRMGILTKWQGMVTSSIWIKPIMFVDGYVSN